MDEALFHAINNLAGRWTFLDAIGIFFAEFAIIILIGLVLMSARPLFYTGVGALGGYIINFIIGAIVQRPRPIIDTTVLQLVPVLSTKSFPSDHAMLAFFCAVTLLLQRRYAGIAIVLAIGVAVGRVYAGVHFPLDVLAGAGIGSAAAVAVHYAIRNT